MNRLLMVVFAAVSIALVLFAFVRVDTQPKQPEVVENVVAEVKAQQAYVLAASRDLTTGSFLEASSVTWQPAGELDEAQLGEVFLKGVFEPADLMGSLVYRSLKKGDVLTADKLIRPEDNGFLSALLTPGMRAISLEMDPSGAGFGQLRPGNYVDVLLTSQSEIEEDTNGQPVFNNMAVETVLQNIRLLAIDARYSAHQKSSLERSPYDPVPVTFEVNLPDAEKLLLASKLGEISLVLRSIGDDSLLEQDALKWAKDISGAHDMEQQPTHAVTVVHGSKE
ncbi:Flp pilus assembly protein CpaB [Thaumasiovibrio subtropicus]|uniref:Flp pilus assembly protein CpaB n=1 Tax=Thaumasiovibrio subtropicus TaxID=1891207 RepID=UPI000B356D0A|nr:Flp pilus assembly protein CpaB [Thaumasiovibrio subtropicus]